ncbi:MAG: thiamine-phosphate kinase [Thermoleophilia bacterium]
MLVSELGEEALIDQLRHLFAVTSADVPLAIGDDAAVIDFSSGHQTVWTTDLLLEDIHFQKSWQTPRQLGRKSLAVNLSDIAAMGAVPRFVLLSIACSLQTEVEFLLEFCRGFCELAVEYGVAVIGGDTSASADGLVVSVSASGQVPTGRALTRSGASIGESVLVTGYLGSAAGGLRLLQEGIDSSRFPTLYQAFVAPVPAVTEARLILESGAGAMTDISDGLASDLKHICDQSSASAVINRSRLPIHPELTLAAAEFDWDPSVMAIAGGEDYGLLFTMAADRATAVAAAIKSSTGTSVTVIGEISAGAAISVVDEQGRPEKMPGSGFDHFLHRG